MDAATNRKIFARNLRYLLDLHKMRDNELCVITGAAQSTVSDWLTAQKYPRIDKLEKLANYFDVPKSYLIEEHEDAFLVEIERQAIAILRSLPDSYKAAAVDYLRYLAERAKKDGNNPVFRP